jgi:DNA primase
MEAHLRKHLVRLHSPFTRTWKPTLVRTTAPRWGAAEREAVDQVLNIYRENLLATPRALDTLSANGVSPEAIEAFRLGFADRSVGKILPGGETYEGAQLRGRLQNVGLFRLNGHTHFHGALVAPVTDMQGRVVDIYGRKISPKLKAGSVYHLSLFDPPQGVFNLVGLLESDEVVLCGDLFDALQFWSAGVRHVTTTVGPRGFTYAHVCTFSVLGIKRVVIALPTNPKDIRLARLIAQALDYMGIRCARMCLPQTVGNAAALPTMVRRAPAFRQSAEQLLRETAP